ncbi:MAG TPA: hypothetical protein VF316_03720 [Polyangiaceae bacterium]
MRPGGTVRAELSSVLKPGAVLLPLWALSARHGRAHAEVLKGLTGGEVLKVAR